MVDLNLDLLIPSIGTMIGLSAVGVIIWNASKKSTTLENKLNYNDEKHTELINKLETRVVEIEKDLVKQISEARIERKEDIGKVMNNYHDKFGIINAQFEALRSDVKGVDSRVTITDTTIKNHQRDLEQIRNCIERIQDRIIEMLKG